MNSTNSSYLSDFLPADVTAARNETGLSDSYGEGYLYGWDNTAVLYVTILLVVRLGICCLAFLINVIVFLFQLIIKGHVRPQYVFTLTLTIADIAHVVSVFGETYCFIQNIFPLPVWYSALVLASNLQSYLSILAVACDRYLALCAIPLKYKQVVTIGKYWTISGVMFSLCLTTGFIFFGSVSYTDVSLALTSFLIPTSMIILTCFVYCRLAYLVSKSLSTIRVSVHVQRRRAAQTKRLIIAFATILAANVICNIPQSLFGLFIVLQPQEKRYNLVENVILGNLLYNVQTLNSCFNPIILWYQILVKQTQLRSFISWLCRFLPAMKRSPDSTKSSRGDRHSKENCVSVITLRNTRMSQSAHDGNHL